MDKGGPRGRVEKWSDSGCISTVELMGLADAWGIGLGWTME